MCSLDHKHEIGFEQSFDPCDCDDIDAHSSVVGSFTKINHRAAIFDRNVCVPSVEANNYVCVEVSPRQTYASQTFVDTGTGIMNSGRARGGTGRRDHTGRSR